MSEALPDADGSRAPAGDFIRRFREIDARFEPRPWPWAEERREAIAAYWARRAAAQPSLFNGRVLLIGDHAIEGDVFRATYFATDYANFLYWLDRGIPDGSVFNGFAMGAGQGSDGGYVLGVMGAHTATAGKVYFPAGTPDPGDLRPDGMVDLATSVVREMEEETGLRPGDYTVADGWIAVRRGGLIAFMRSLTFREPAESVRARIRAYLARQREPELADVRIVRSLADLDEAAMPAYLKAFLRWVYEEADSIAIARGVATRERDVSSAEARRMTIHAAPPSPLIAALAERLGAAHALVEAVDLEGHLVDARGLFRGTAVAVARPRDTAEVAFVVRTCAEAGVPIVAQGGNTGLVGGGVPHGGIVLSLARLDRIRAVDPVNATLTAEAGCVLKAVQEAAERAGLLFPLSLASEGSCRIGGNLATNAGGTGVLRYGNARDLVLGLEVVLADGRVWNGLTALRKDNTGYDLKDLFIGSEGTLGIITAAVLKLFPRPARRAVAFVGCASPHAALDLFGRLRAAAGEALTAFEYMPRFGLEIVLRHVGGTVRPLAGDHESYALIEVSSPRADADLQDLLETVLGEAMEDGTVEDATVGSSEARNAALWRLREELSEVQGREGASIKHDVAVPLSRVAEFIEAASRACEAALPGIRVCAFGHFGDGNIHFNLSQPVGMEKGAFLGQWERFNRIVHDLVAAMDGSIAAEHGVGLLKRDELLRYKDPVAIDLMRTLKDALDPRGLLNPGKVVAGGEGAPSALPIAPGRAG